MPDYGWARRSTARWCHVDHIRSSGSISHPSRFRSRPPNACLTFALNAETLAVRYHRAGRLPFSILLMIAASLLSWERTISTIAG